MQRHAWCRDSHVTCHTFPTIPSGIPNNSILHLDLIFLASCLLLLLFLPYLYSNKNRLLLLYAIVFSLSFLPLHVNFFYLLQINFGPWISLFSLFNLSCRLFLGTQSLLLFFFLWWLIADCASYTFITFLELNIVTCNSCIWFSHSYINS